ATQPSNARQMRLIQLAGRNNAMSMPIDSRQRRDDLVAQLSTLEHARSFSQLGCPPRRVSQRPIWESCCRAFSHNQGRYQTSSTRVEAKGLSVSQSTCRAYGSTNAIPLLLFVFLYPRFLVNEISKHLVIFRADNFDVDISI